MYHVAETTFDVEVHIDVVRVSLQREKAQSLYTSLLHEYLR
jgi:hypothetical protein